MEGAALIRMSETEKPIIGQGEGVVRPSELADVSLHAQPELRKGVADEQESISPRDANVRSVPEDKFQFGSFVHN